MSRAHAPLGSAPASGAGDDALVIAHFSTLASWFAGYKVRFGGAPKPAREGACAPQNAARVCFYSPATSEKLESLGNHCPSFGKRLFWPPYRLLHANEFSAFPADIIGN